MKTAAQIFGIGAMASLFLLYQQKERKRLIAAKLCADICWAAHYLLLGGTAGMIPNVMGIFRETVFIRRGNKKWADTAAWPVFFILCSWCMGLHTFRSAVNILPIAASSLVTVSLWVKNPGLTKLITIPVSAAFILYDLYVGSFIGILNESLSILSIILSLIKEKMQMHTKTENNRVFSEDFPTVKELKMAESAEISSPAAVFSSRVGADSVAKGDAFAGEIGERFISDFEKSAAYTDGEADRMVHVSTFMVIDGMLYMSYYANTKEPSENPENQTARLVYCPLDDPDDKTFLDIQSAGDTFSGKTVDMVYDTILMQKDADTIYILWTARIDGNYYRFYRPFTLSTKALGEVQVNRFKVGDIVNDFSVSGIKSALGENEICCKKMYSDIGIMQKLSSRRENGETYYYTGAYSGDFACIIKSRDLITWEYVSQPDFVNLSKWENAVYVMDDTCFCFFRQNEPSRYGFLTAYDLINGVWAPPVLVEDCQSRADFIVYHDALYLFHAPIDREHIGILRINRESLADSEIVLQAHMHTSCFYPFVQYYTEHELAMSYTVNRQHIRLARFTLSKYI